MSAVAASLVDLEALTPFERAKLGARLNREAMQDKSYELLPLGADVAAYLRARYHGQAENTRRAYEGSLDKFARHFADLRLEDFELPVGRERVRDYLHARWGDAQPATYNLHLSALQGFFQFWHLEGRLSGVPTAGVQRARKRQPQHHTFSGDQRRAIVASAASRRDRVALRLLFDYGLRRGSLKAVRFKHFDHQRRRLTVFGKGGTVREMPLPDPDLWLELERLILDLEAQPDHLLMCRERPVPRVGVRRFPDQEVSGSTLHRWFYRRLAEAGLVPEGTFSSDREMSLHVARHTAGQRLLDATGNVAAVKSLLGHQSIQTTVDTYVDWDEGRLAASLLEVFREG